MPLEELQKQARALLGEYSGHHLGPVVEASVANHVPQGADRPGLLVERPEDQHRLWEIRESGLAATARVSIGLYNTEEEIGILANAIEESRQMFV